MRLCGCVCVVGFCYRSVSLIFLWLCVWYPKTNHQKYTNNKYKNTRQAHMCTLQFYAVHPLAVPYSFLSLCLFRICCRNIAMKFVIISNLGLLYAGRYICCLCIASCVCLCVCVCIYSTLYCTWRARIFFALFHDAKKSRLMIMLMMTTTTTTMTTTTQ